MKPGRVIGNGAFGFVFEAFDEIRQCKVAVKRTQKAGDTLSREFEILDMLRGKPYIVQMLDFYYTEDESNRLIQNTVLEYCDTSLHELISRQLDEETHLPIGAVRKYARELFTGLAVMHERGIIHRDLKPENVLLTSDSVRIADLGSAKILDKEQFCNTPYVVSRYYRAPELLLASNRYTESIDVWSVACISFELVAKTVMFPGDSEGLQLVEM